MPSITKRGRSSPTFVWRIAWAAALPLLAVQAAAAATPAEPAVRAFVERIGLSDADVAAADGGGVVTRILRGAQTGDVVVVALLRVCGAMEPLAGGLAQLDPFLSLGDSRQYGLFGEPPRIEDLDALRFDRRDLRDARGCEPRDCSLKLDRAGMDRVRGWRAGPRGADARLADLLKESMLDAVAAYRRDGSLPVYLDKSHPVSVSDELRSSLEGSPYLDGGTPFLRYVLGYPRVTLPDTRDIYYWSSEKLRKPITSVHHLAIHRLSDGGVVRYAVADQHISDSHYFRARIELLWLLRGDDTSGFYCVRLSRARIDPPAWFSGIAMGKVRHRTRESLERQLRAARQRFQASPHAANEPNGPYQTIVR